MMKRIVVLLSALFMLVLAACGGEDNTSNENGTNEASNESELDLKVGIVVGDWSNQYAGLDEWVELVEEETDGRIKLTIYPDGQLGGERELLESVQNNTLDIGVVSSFVFANFVPETAVIDIPYIVSNFDDAEALFDGPFGDRVSEVMTEKGLRNLAWGHNDFRVFANNKHAIESPDDLSGLKMRVPESNITSEWYQSLGASPTTMPFTDVYTALQQGVVDGQESGPFMVYSAKFYEYQKHLTTSNHQYSPIGYFISDDAWNKLSADDQEIISTTVLKAAELNRENTRETAQKALEQMEAEGVEITTLTDEALQQFRETNKPLIEKARGIAGDELTDLILEESAKFNE